jgi:hypothetical protein
MRAAYKRRVRLKKNVKDYRTLKNFKRKKFAIKYKK